MKYEWEMIEEILKTRLELKTIVLTDKEGKELDIYPKWVEG